MTILRETTPLSEKDCFMVFSREKSAFDFPIHVHQEYELNFIENAKGASRVVGDSIEDIDDLELTLIAGSGLEHGWLNHRCESKVIKEITIQFHPDLLNEKLLMKNQFRLIKKMFDRAANGVTFPKDVILKIKDSLYGLVSEKEGFYSVMKLFSILHELSLSDGMRVLSSRSFCENNQRFDSRRVDKIIHYLMDNYTQDIALRDVSDLVGMTEVSVSRFLKQRTGRTFIDTLNEIRLGYSSRMLIDTTHTVAEIALLNGFNNLSNFNRIFLKKKGMTPTKFREKYRNSKFFL